MTEEKTTCVMVDVIPENVAAVEALCDMFEEIGMEDPGTETYTYIDGVTGSSVSAYVTTGDWKVRFPQPRMRRLIGQIAMKHGVDRISIQCWEFDDETETPLWRLPILPDEVRRRKQFERRILRELAPHNDRVDRLAKDGLFDEALEPLDKSIAVVERFQRRWVEWYGEPKDTLTNLLLVMETNRLSWGGPRDNLS